MTQDEIIKDQKKCNDRIIKRALYLKKKYGKKRPPRYEVANERLKNL